MSQNRNSVLELVAPNSLNVAQTAQFIMYSASSSQFEQLTAYHHFPNPILELLEVEAHYGSHPGDVRDWFYADACGWDPDPLSPGSSYYRDPHDLHKPA